MCNFCVEPTHTHTHRFLASEEDNKMSCTNYSTSNKNTKMKEGLIQSQVNGFFYSATIFIMPQNTTNIYTIRKHLNCCWFLQGFLDIAICIIHVSLTPLPSLSWRSSSAVCRGRRMTCSPASRKTRRTSTSSWRSTSLPCLRSTSHPPPVPLFSAARPQCGYIHLVTFNHVKTSSGPPFDLIRWTFICKLPNRAYWPEVESWIMYTPHTVVYWVWVP